MQLNLSNFSGKILAEKLKALRKTENTTLADIVLHLVEIDSRKLYRELGYSSLFTYCTEALGYSEGSAYRRVQAARCVATNPETYELIKSGKVTLCALSEISKVKEPSVKTEIIKVSEGKTRDEVKVLTAPHLPPAVPKRESVKPVLVKSEASSEPNLFSGKSSQSESSTSDKLVYNFALEVDGEFMKLYREAKEITGHIPGSEVLTRALREFIYRRRTVKRESKVSANSRYIPKSLRLTVLKRDENRCSYVSRDGKRCMERHGLQIDHIKPYGIGGLTDESNLRVLCPAHNLLMAERVFGRSRVPVKRA